MNNHTTTGRKRRFILRAGLCYFGGGMFLLFNYRFIANMHDYTMPYFIFRLIFSGLLFATAGFVAASLVAKRFGMK